MEIQRLKKEAEEVARKAAEERLRREKEEKARKAEAERLRKEAEECYLAETLEWASRQEMSDIAEGLIMGKVPGYEITAGSSWQSLKRSTGDIETEYLNGEISLLGRMNKISTPYNDFFVILAREFVRDRRQPGSMPLEEFLTRFDFFRSKG